MRCVAIAKLLFTKNPQVHAPTMDNQAPELEAGLLGSHHLNCKDLKQYISPGDQKRGTTSPAVFQSLGTSLIGQCIVTFGV
jgi:hypothetical protein